MARAVEDPHQGGDVPGKPDLDVQQRDGYSSRDGDSNGGHETVQRRLKSYHILMIGISSGIGTGLFIGTGSAYATSGPAGLLLAYIIIGFVLWCVMQSIGELATLVRITFFPCRRFASDSPTVPNGRVLSPLRNTIHRPRCWILLGNLLWVLLHDINRSRVLGLGCPGCILERRFLDSRGSHHDILGPDPGH